MNCLHPQVTFTGPPTALKLFEEGSAQFILDNRLCYIKSTYSLLRQIPRVSLFPDYIQGNVLLYKNFTK